MLVLYRNFLRGIAVNWFGKIGVALTTSTFISFIMLEMARMAGVFTNQYMGLITYLAFPALFVIGLLLIPIGWHRYAKSRQMTTRELLTERFDPSDIQAHRKGSRFFLTVIVLSLLNVIFLSASSVRMLHFMDNSEFCGTACHVMSPEWTVYQDSPHAKVKCVECHVGEGIDALISAKLEGTRQMILASTNTYHRPIPTPVHNLRPASETCKKCHWPEKFYGRRLKMLVRYQDDETSSPLYHTLAIKVDKDEGTGKGGIHWHIAAQNEVRYTSVNDERQEIIWVEMRQPDGTYKRFVNKALDKTSEKSNLVRTMDCVDCHNRATHIYEDPAVAVDTRIQRGQMDRTLPYLKREAVAAITAEYATKDEANSGIARRLHDFYQKDYPELATEHKSAIDQATLTLQQIYQRNIFPEMKITWGTYRTMLGHPNDEGGCFRCHTTDLEAEDGTTISDDCETCHAVIGFEEPEPPDFMVTEE